MLKLKGGSTSNSRVKLRKPAPVGEGTSYRFGLANTDRTTPENEFPEADLTDFLIELCERGLSTTLVCGINLQLKNCKMRAPFKLFVTLFWGGGTATDHQPLPPQKHLNERLARFRVAV
jgi:hypothetical protein